MSTPRDISATTTAFRTLLQSSLPTGCGVTTLSLARAEQLAGKRGAAARLNLSLWRIGVASVAREMPLGRPPVSIETPPAPLELHYLVTAYGTADSVAADSVDRLLAAAFRTVNGHPILGAAEMAAAGPDSDPSSMPRQVQLVWQSLPVDELTNLFLSCRAELRPVLTYVARLTY